MQELIDKAHDLLRAILRFRWTVLGIAWAVAIVGWTYVHSLDYLYSARARVIVDSNRILEPLLKGIAIQPDVNERVSLMSQTLLNRPNLERLARMSDLDTGAATDYEQETLLDELGSTVQLSGSRSNSSLYTVSYQHTDPRVARRVVQSLITVFVESSLGDERSDSSSAQAFLDQQIVDYESRLLSAERRLSAFKRANAGKMPGESGGYYQRLDVATNLERASRLELREAQNRRASLRRQTGEARPAVSSGGVVAPSAIEAQLREQSAELSALLVRYTGRHPRVAQLRESIAALEERKAEAARAAGAAGAAERPSAPQASTGYDLASGAFYQELRTLLAEADARVSELEVRVEEYGKQVIELEGTIESIPKVEAELQQLDRDYSIVKTQYETLLERRESARLSERVEQNADDVKFRVIDPPFVPSRPSSPDKPLLSIAVFVAAFGLGGAAAFALSMLRPVFYDPETVAARTGHFVIGTISLRRGVDPVWPSRLGWLLYIVLVILLGLAFVAVIAAYKGWIGPENVEPLLRSPIGPVIEQASRLLVRAVDAGGRLVGRFAGGAGE